MEFKITLPTSKDAFGQWLETHGARVEIGCMLGRFEITVDWCKVHSYSDDRGEHRECWSVSRYHADFQTAFRLAVEAAEEIQCAS